MLFVLGDFSMGYWNVLSSEISIQLIIANLIFILAALTDWLDGQLARKYELVTNFGKFADPLADKLLVLTALILLIELGLVASWLVAIIVAREISVTGLRLLLVEEGGKVLAAAWPGKIKTTSQMLAIVFLLVDDFPFGGLSLSIGNIMLYIALFFTVYSGIEYFYHARHIFSDVFH